MTNYFKTDSIIVNDLDNISDLYAKGYVFTRVKKGSMDQTRSLRVHLPRFQLSSENRRVLSKNEDLSVELKPLPLENYSWEIHALGKNFYETKFGDKVMSAAKIKEMFTSTDSSNMNCAFIYKSENNTIGYCLAYKEDTFLHYAYPFYNLDIPKEQSTGMAMMLKAIIWAQEQGMEYIYLGSVVKPESKYKLQFNGVEWWDGEKWSEDIDLLKTLIVD